MATHCSGPFGTGQLVVPAIGSGVGVLDPGAGNRRGIVVGLHGGVGGSPGQVPQPTPSDAFSINLKNDGWIKIDVSMPEDYVYIPGASGAIYNDVANDAGNGSRYLATWLEEWDHIINYLNLTYGAGRPLVVFGGSDGGWKSLQVASARMSSVIGYMATIPACYWDTVNPAFTPPNDFSAISFAGMQLSATWLNAVTIPGWVNYNTTDNAVGWWNDVITSGSNGVNVNTFTGSGVLNVVSGNSFVVGPRVQVTGLTGGVGQATISFTGVTSTTLTGCRTVSGSGTLATNNPCIQNFTILIVVNGVNAGQPISQFASTSGGHTFTAAAQADAFTWVQTNMDPLAPANTF